MRFGMVSFVSLLLAATALLRGAHLPVRAYTTDDGLASNYIYRIVEDSRGFLWFCTRDGISRFDGYQFASFGRDQGLPGRDEDLIETRSGEYWIATGDGVARLSLKGSEREFTLYRPADPKARETHALADDGAGGVWLGTSAGLYHLERTHDGWAMRFIDIGMPAAEFGDNLIEALLRDRRGNLWIGGHRALYWRSADGRYHRCRLRNDPGRDHILALLEDREGRLWIGTWTGLLQTSINADRSEPLIEKVYTPKNGLAGEQVYALLESSDGQLWAGTSGGLSRYMPHGPSQEFESFRTANGLSRDQVDALGKDRAGNLWVGGSGAYKISRAGFTSYGQPDGLASEFVVSIFEDHSGHLCANTRDARFRAYVNCFDGQRFHSVLPNLPRQIIGWGWGIDQITFQDHAGNWWVPGEGLVQFSKLSALPQLEWARAETVYSARNGLPGTVLRVFEDSRGDVWISAWVETVGRSVTRWERATGSLVHYSIDGVSGTALATAFAEDRGGNVWIGFSEALARVRNDRIQVFGPPEEMGRFGVRTLYPDQEGRLWVADRNALVRIDSPDAETPKFMSYTTAQGLASNDVQCVTEDKFGRIYAGTGRGVDSFYPRAPLRIRHYTQADGLALGNEMEAFRDRTGTLWFGSPKGLSRLAPEPERSREAPSILISALRVRGAALTISPLGETELSGLKLAADQNQIEMEFVGLGFGTGEVLRYQYRLEGADQDWSQPTAERRIAYARLAPGSYRFLVRAATTDGLVSAKPAAVAFTIAPPLYQRGWLRLLVIALLAAALYVLHRNRLARLLEVERLRTRIATDLHDDIGSTLSQIAILSEVARRSSNKVEQLQPLSDIAELSRESVESMSDIVWAIDPEHDRLGDLSRRMRRFANDLFISNGTLVQFRGPAEQELELDAEIRRQIFLIFKESLHNAARHSGCTELEIDFRLEKASLNLVLHDNGRGFDVTEIRKGHGLSSIEKRAAELGGCATIDSAPGRGTTIRVRIPVGRHLVPSRKRASSNH